MARVEIDGVGIAYEDVGEGEAVLLLHSGFVADGMLPLSGEPSLSAYRLVRYHRRGYGDSDRVAPPVSLVRQAEDAVALLDHLDIPRAHVVGHSLGATIAVQLALGSPERVGSLVVLDCFLPSALSAEAAAVVGAAAAEALPLFAAGDHARAVDSWLSAAFGSGYRPVLDRALPGAWERAVADAPSAFGVELPAVQEWTVGPHDLGAVEAPTLSVVNNEDCWVGFQEMHQAVVSGVPDAAEVQVDVPTHLLQIANPEPVAAAVTFPGPVPSSLTRRSSSRALPGRSSPCRASGSRNAVHPLACSILRRLSTVPGSNKLEARANAACRILQPPAARRAAALARQPAYPVK